MTAKGAEVAISVDRGTYLRDGDVLLWDAQALSALVARIEVRDVMIVHLEELMRLAPQVALRTCVELGHAMGNQHWPALVKGDLVYVPLTVDRRVMASVMETHRFEGIRYEFVSGRAVVPYLAPHESRRLRRGGRSGALAHARELYRHRHGDGTGIRTPASALPSASGDRYSCTWIAAQSRFHARAGG